MIFPGEGLHFFKKRGLSMSSFFGHAWNACMYKNRGREDFETAQLKWFQRKNEWQVIV